MIKLSALLLFFAITPLPVNAQTQSGLSSLGSYLPVKASHCQPSGGSNLLHVDDCQSAHPGSHRIQKTPRQNLFGLEGLNEEKINHDNLPAARIDSKRSPIPLIRLSVPLNSEADNKDHASTQAGGDTGFKWKSAINQYLLLMAVEHGYDLTQDKTRRELKGPFFKDYFRSVAGLGGWADGGKFFTNYVAHPMEGAIYGFIQVQNDPKGKGLEFGMSKRYWISRLKSMGWSAVCSTQFEIGPLSQAAIGNVGLHTDHTGKHKRKMAYVDLVITPTLGTGWLVGEDIVDRYVLGRFDRSMNNRFLRNMMRTVLNPMRSGANLVRFKVPWHRDN